MKEKDYVVHECRDGSLFVAYVTAVPDERHPTTYRAVHGEAIVDLPVARARTMERLAAELTALRRVAELAQIDNAGRYRHPLCSDPGPACPACALTQALDALPRKEGA